MSGQEEASREVFNLVKALTELPGPTGHEDAVQDWLANRWNTFSREVVRTAIGNIVAHVGGMGKRLLILGHADEICLMVKSVTDDGFLHIWPYSADTLGHPPRWFMPINQPALVITEMGSVDGVFATASGHVVGGQQSRKDSVEWNDWFIDVGANSRAETESLGIHPGCRAIWNPTTRRLGKRNIVGKAMDDRGALAIATLVGERLAGRDDLAYELWLGSVVQEENGFIGASSLADHTHFDLCITLDVGLTGDIPGPDPRDFPAKLGAGPTLVYKDHSCHYSRRLTGSLAKLAEEREIPVQKAIFANYGSDGSALMRRGVETALVTYPTRYTHTPIETVDENDLIACVDLIEAFATTQSGELHQK